ncbi:hypothetical protein GUJ93_ZPchr0013g36513 [Zizania palustris]|uniref:Uncharacterized protein n=1 Tax=Zizania palustris TaxID=103762 RepID=A0A8J5X5J7_ZIZPA|nr:hypothetical protein GUJ93_ZPchr0013g36513 [Zizania palustris]
MDGNEEETVVPGRGAMTRRADLLDAAAARGRSAVEPTSPTRIAQLLLPRANPAAPITLPRRLVANGCPI